MTSAQKRDERGWAGSSATQGVRAGEPWTLDTRDQDCEAAGRDSCWRCWGKLQTSLEIPLISQGYKTELGCQTNTSELKLNVPTKALDPTPGRASSKKESVFSLNWLLFQTLAKFVGAYREPEDQLTSLMSAHYPCAAAGSMDGPCLLWQLSFGVMQKKRHRSSPAMPKTTPWLRARQAAPLHPSPYP